jgi:hypothetical protein
MWITSGGEKFCRAPREKRTANHFFAKHFFAVCCGKDARKRMCTTKFWAHSKEEVSRGACVTQPRATWHGHRGEGPCCHSVRTTLLHLTLLLAPSPHATCVVPRLAAPSTTRTTNGAEIASPRPVSPACVPLATYKGAQELQAHAQGLPPRFWRTAEPPLAAIAANTVSFVFQSLSSCLVYTHTSPRTLGASQEVPSSQKWPFPQPPPLAVTARALRSPLWPFQASKSNPRWVYITPSPFPASQAFPSPDSGHLHRCPRPGTTLQFLRSFQGPKRKNQGPVCENQSFRSRVPRLKLVKCLENSRNIIKMQINMFWNPCDEYYIF